MQSPFLLRIDKMNKLNYMSYQTKKENRQHKTEKSKHSHHRPKTQRKLSIYLTTKISTQFHIKYLTKE